MKNWIKLSKLPVKVHFEGKNDIILPETNGFAFILTILIEWISIGNSVTAFHTFKITHFKCNSEYEIFGDHFQWIIGLKDPIE